MKESTKRDIFKILGEPRTMEWNDDYMGTSGRMKKEITLDILIRAMWAINDNSFKAKNGKLIVDTNSGFVINDLIDNEEVNFKILLPGINYFKHNNTIESRTQALSAAVAYVVENKE